MFYFTFFQKCHANAFGRVSAFWAIQVPCYCCYSLLSSRLDAMCLWSTPFALGMVMGSLLCCKQFSCEQVCATKRYLVFETGNRQGWMHFIKYYFEIDVFINFMLFEAEFAVEIIDISRFSPTLSISLCMKLFNFEGIS